MKSALITILYILSVFISSEIWGQPFEIQSDFDSGVLQVFKAGVSHPVVTQNAKKGMRPYLHPVRTPDGRGVITEIHPDHHLHQTGIYWGLKKVNGRDFFMNYTGELDTKRMDELWKSYASESALNNDFK